MKIVYFASLRERLGLSEEDVALPAEARTVADVIAFLSARDELYADAFASGKMTQEQFIHAAEVNTYLGPIAESDAGREINILTR